MWCHFNINIKYLYQFGFLKLTSRNGLKVAKAGHRSEGCMGMMADRHFGQWLWFWEAERGAMVAKWHDGWLAFWPIVMVLRGWEGGAWWLIGHDGWLAWWLIAMMSDRLRFGYLSWFLEAEGFLWWTDRRTFKIAIWNGHGTNMILIYRWFSSWVKE